MAKTRSVWSGSITVGLLQFLVRMYVAARPERVGLHLFHTACSGSVKQPNYCPECKAFLESGEVFKGFIGPDNKIVPVTAEEIEKITPDTEHAMEITQCVLAAEIPQDRFAESFYLGPDVGADKAYTLLAEILKRKKLIALAQISKGNREHVAMIWPKDNGQGKTVLALSFMWYDDEIAQVPELQNLKPVDVSTTELKLAGELLDSITGPFESAEFEDGYNMALKQLIASKLPNSSIPAPAPVKVTKAVPTLDIEKALAQSLANAKARKPAAPATKGKKGKVA